MQIYMDVCCLNRPFDDLTQDRVYLEAEAVLSILTHCEQGDWTLLSSGVIDFELSRIVDVDRLERVNSIYSVANKHAPLTSEIELRAAVLQQTGLKPFDSLHIATAEGCGADIFLTTDDRLIKASSKSDFKVKISNPTLWLMEVTANE